MAIEIDVEMSGVNDTSLHNRLSNRNLSDQHPISAITGLQTALDGKVGNAYKGGFVALEDVEFPSAQIISLNFSPYTEYRVLCGKCFMLPVTTADSNNYSKINDEYEQVSTYDLQYMKTLSFRAERIGDEESNSWILTAWRSNPLTQGYTPSLQTNRSAVYTFYEATALTATAYSESYKWQAGTWKLWGRK